MKTVCLLAATARPWAALFVASILLAGLGAPAPGRTDILPGPVRADVVAVVDGDTLLVRARIWLDQEIRVHVRVAGIDAPERRGGCDAERELAERARQFVVRAVTDTRVMLHEVQHGKYAGRVVARVATADGRDLGTALVAAGLARAYDGGARESWCEAAARLRQP